MREGEFFVPLSEQKMAQTGETEISQDKQSNFSFRNRMLRCLGLATALFSSSLVAPSEASARESVIQSFNSLEFQDDKENASELKLEVQKRITEYENTPSSLSQDEIVQYLTVSPFLKKEKLKVVDIDVDEQTLLDKKDVLKETLDRAVRNGVIQSDSQDLQVVRIDFEKISHPPLSAVYVDEYNVILVPFSETTVTPVLKKFFGLKYRDEKEARTNTVLGTFDQEVEDFKSKVHSLDDIPESFIEKYGNEFLSILKTEREFLALSRGVIKNALPHEGFHYFFDTYLREKASGYSGPDLAVLLESALTTKNLRFGKGAAPDYYQVNGQVVDTLFEHFQLDDEQKRKEFCKKLAHSIQSRAKQWDFESVSEHKTKEELLMEGAEEFVNEALARSYAVAVGVDREQSIENVEQELFQIGGTLSEEEKFAIASPQNVPMLLISEVELFEQMKIDGQSVILVEGQKIYDDLK